MRGLQLLLVLLVIVVVCAEIASATGTSVGTPIRRPKPKPNCPGLCGIGARCDRKEEKCVCLRNMAGNPGFICYNPNRYYMCQILADPMLTAFDNQTSGIKMPGPLALTTVSTRRIGRGGGMCQVSVSGWTARFGGKYFIEALEFKLYQILKDGSRSANKFRVIGKVINGGYYYTILVWEQTGWSVVGDIAHKGNRTANKIVDKCSVKFFISQSKFLVTNIMCCAFKFAIRPYNEENEDIIPGTYILVKKPHKLRPNQLSIKSLHRCLCNNATDSPLIDVLKSDYGFTSRTQYSTFIGLAYGRPVVYPGSYDNLAALQATLTSCEEAKVGNFMKKCEFLFNYTKLIACQKENMMSLIHEVAKGFCENDTGACAAANMTLTETCQSVAPNDQMKDFVKNGCE